MTNIWMVRFCPRGSHQMHSLNFRSEEKARSEFDRANTVAATRKGEEASFRDDFNVELHVIPSECDRLLFNQASMVGVQALTNSTTEEAARTYGIAGIPQGSTH